MITDEQRYEELIRKYEELNVKMKDLYGNGEPGRVTSLEAVVNTHNRYLWMALGALAIITPILMILAQEYISHMWSK